VPFNTRKKGIIHRDLKPSNVLITVVDRRPVPKVIDFGVAKAIDRRLNQSTELTQFGQIIGTLAYMSPEQAGGTESDVDTRAGIYALGVLLYELLTGDTPLPHQQWQEASLLKAVMLVKEATATKLSLRIKSAGNADRIALDRRTSPTRLYRSLEGDIDAIVLKCLERDRGGSQGFSKKILQKILGAGDGGPALYIQKTLRTRASQCNQSDGRVDRPPIVGPVRRSRRQCSLCLAHATARAGGVAPLQASAGSGCRRGRRLTGHLCDSRSPCRIASMETVNRPLVISCRVLHRPQNAGKSAGSARGVERGARANISFPP
jgi:serine/threonine protein kinase